jgi:PhzF family phenazine biosynthesis protein
LGAKPVYVGKNKFDYLVQLDSEQTLRALQPDHSALRKLPVRGIIVTARGKDHDFVSRFFAPGSGIDEDPVTGSAHCALGPYWASILNKTEFRAFQASPRGGEVGVRLAGDRAILRGQAVTVLQGDLLE